MPDLGPGRLGGSLLHACGESLFCGDQALRDLLSDAPDLRLRARSRSLLKTLLDHLVSLR